MDSGIGNSLLAKSLDRDSIQGDCHAALFRTPASDLLTILEVGDLFDSPFQISEFLTEGFFQIFASVGNHLLEKTTALNSVRKQL